MKWWGRRGLCVVRPSGDALKVVTPVFRLSSWLVSAIRRKPRRWKAAMGADCLGKYEGGRCWSPPLPTPTSLHNLPLPHTFTFCFCVRPRRGQNASLLLSCLASVIHISVAHVSVSVVEGFSFWSRREDGERRLPPCYVLTCGGSRKPQSVFSHSSLEMWREVMFKEFPQ